MNRSDRRFLRSLILEQVEELFAEPSAEEDAEKIQNSSADSQIDSFILKFEKDSIGSESEDLGESLRNLSLGALLSEQAGEEAEEVEVEEEEEEVAEPAADAPKGDKVKPAAEIPKPPLDIEEFTQRVARLAMNFESLIDMKTIIVNRATNFLLENYDETKASEMRDLLDTEFDFDLSGGKENPPAPYAVGAFQGGTGQMGGGGA